MAENKKVDITKLVLENDLNRDTIRRLLQILREITDNIFDRTDNNEILKISGDKIETLKNYYKNIIDSITKIE